MLVLTFGHVSRASVNIFWIGMAENDATARGVHFRSVLEIKTLIHFINFAKALSNVNRKHTQKYEVIRIPRRYKKLYSKSRYKII